MKFQETPLAGAFIITMEIKQDERGFFARSFCKNEFEQLGLQGDFVQSNLSYNHKKNTLRGLHYQKSTYEEMKVVSCQRGSIYDVIVDIRKTSTTYGQWFGVELSAENYKMLYVPIGFAHGFQTLCDHVEVHYLMGHYFQPEAAAGIRCDDSTLAIHWPSKEVIISPRDKNLPDFPV